MDDMQKRTQATAWRQSLREHCQLNDGRWDWRTSPHWLLIFRPGRAVLLLKLWCVRPEAVLCRNDPSRIDPLLDAMVDEMGLRKLVKPSCVTTSLLCYFRIFLRVSDS